jgi:PAS domain S-box-containing protein
MAPAAGGGRLPPALLDTLGRLFQRVPSFVLVLEGPQHRYALLNDAYRELFGDRAQIGQPVERIYPELRAQGVIDLLDRVYRTGERYEARGMQVDFLDPATGTPRTRVLDFTYQPLRDERDAVAGILVEGYEITARIDAERRLRESESKYRALFDRADEGFCVVEVLWDSAGSAADYRFLEVNQAFERESGMRNVVGRTLRECVPEVGSVWIERVGRAAATGEPVRHVDQAMSTGRWYEVHAFRYDEAWPSRVAMRFNNVTDKKRAEQALAASEERHRALAERLETALGALKEQDRRKDEFLAVLAHELRNPLAPLTSVVELMRMAPPQGDELLRLRGVLERQVRHLGRLVDDLLDVARIGAGKIQLRRVSVDLREVVRQAAEAAGDSFARAGLALALSLPDEPLVVDGDEVRLTQIVGNLLSNAAKYGTRGDAPGGRVTVALRREQQQAVLEVADEGIGLPAELLPRLFTLFGQAEPLQRRAQDGLGVGLALVQRLVALHEGSVAAHSEGPDHGSRFTVRLPLLAAAARAEPSRPAPGEIPHEGEPLALVVDDNRDAADSLAALLGLMGAQVRVAYDGWQGLQALQARAPHVVFLDIGMPGINGYETARRMRAATGTGAAPLIVALTGWGQEADKAQAREAGFDLHLTKPASLEQVQQALALARSRTAEAA